MWFTNQAFLSVALLATSLGSNPTALASGPFRDVCESFESEMVTSLRPLKKCLDDVKSPEIPSLCKAENDAFIQAQVRYHACRKKEFPRVEKNVQE